MHIVACRETWHGERRTALIPANVAKLVGDGFRVSVERGIGVEAGFTDEAYVDAGAAVEKNDGDLLGTADVVLSVRRPDVERISLYRADSLHIGFLDPFREPEILDAFAAQRVSAISMEMIPRITRAQKMDALSSQASLSGYVAMLLAAIYLPRIFPMMMTAAGTLSPARVFVIGAGVAGLQAIATAQRLGARVEAFDTRPVVKEEVQSLGAKFIEIDIGETGQTEQGYAQALTAEQMEMQQQGMAAVIARSDIVVTAAQVFGRAAPQIVTEEMVHSMRPSSVVVDTAIESGGNVAIAQFDSVLEVNGVTVVGLANLPSRVAGHASQMYSNNVLELIGELKVDEAAALELDRENEILAAALVTNDGAVLETGRGS